MGTENKEILSPLIFNMTTSCCIYQTIRQHLELDAGVMELFLIRHLRNNRALLSMKLF